MYNFLLILHIISDDAIFFSRWILVTSRVGAPAVNFLSPNFTLHVQIIVNMLFMLLLLLIYLLFFYYYYYYHFLYI